MPPTAPTLNRDRPMRSLSAEALFACAQEQGSFCGPALLGPYDLDAIDRRTAMRYHTAIAFRHQSRWDRPPRRHTL